MRSVRVALAAGLAITAAAGGGVLAQAPVTVLARNSITARHALVVSWQNASGCQAHERLPAGTVAIRLALGAVFGPQVTVRALDGSRLLTSGSQQSGWTGKNVTIPVRPLASATSPAEICFATGPSSEGVDILGAGTSQPGETLASAGQPVGGRMGVEYLGQGHSSWLALASSVASHMALGRAWSGTWVVFLVAILMLVVATLASWLTIRESGHSNGVRRRAVRPSRWARARERVPTAAWICAVVACLNAASWSFITPPFQVPDEPSHFAYVKQLAQTGTLPYSSNEAFSSEEQFALTALGYLRIRQDPTQRAIFSQAQQDTLEERLQALSRSPEGKGSPAAGVATSQPPLYYALESITYNLASSGTLLDRLQLMRLLSALIAGGTALFTFLFLRETLPRAPWAWTVGALAVALTPLLAFMSGGVNPDSLLFAVSAALFYCLARALRRGLTMRPAIATGLVIAAGVLTKLTFVGLLPAALLALCILAARGAPSRRTLSAAATAAALGCAPLVFLVARNSTSATVTGATRTNGSPLAVANYLWQFYLPRLPGTANDFPGLSMTRQVWFDRFVGRFGWLDTVFPHWVYTLALIPATAIAALCLRALVANRAVLRARASELVVYALMALGLMLIVGFASYHEYPQLIASWGQPRYLLVLAPLLGAIVALAARGAGSRWGPAAGALIVVLFLAHDIFSQLQVIARYYG